MIKKVVNVAIALIYQQGTVLVGWRDETLHQGGCYEFPGGKVEATETPIQAVCREVKEEVGVEIEDLKLFQQQQFDYGDRVVHLHFYWCQLAQYQSLDVHSTWQWVSLDQLKKLSFPAANQPILQRLAWPVYLAISAENTDFQAQQALFFPEIEGCYLRQKYHSMQQIYADIDVLGHQNQQIILNLDYFLSLDEAVQHTIFAVHLNHQQLHSKDIKTILEKLKNKNLLAACHDAEDILQANRLGCNAIFLSPVQPTATHQEQVGMGWEQFQQWVNLAQMPVYALGGIKREVLASARQFGAYGVAGIRDFILR